jgi:dihydropteroate synthase
LGAGEVYLHPRGLVWGAAAREAARSGAGGLIAGGTTAFTTCEIVAREGGAVRRSWMSYEALRAARDRGLAERLALIEAPRPAVAGFDFARPVIMGVVNVTPDSFSDGGRNPDPASATAHGRMLAA